MRELLEDMWSYGWLGKFTAVSTVIGIILGVVLAVMLVGELM